MAKKQGGLRSPLTSAFPPNHVEGDRRDYHDQNPHFPESAKHDRGKNTPPNVFFEGEDLGDFMGVVDEVTPDILSSPMGGQRRTTGVRESPNSTLGCESKK